MMRLVLLLALAATAGAQQPAAKADETAKPAKKAEVPALPEGKTKVYRAIVLKVVGIAQARADRAKDWKDLKVNDVLQPGATVRTGRKSMVALRVGVNATMLIDRQTRIAIPEIIQNGEKLKTRVSLEWGRTEVKVNKVGRINDFEVATPSATLAVRGTAFRVMWDVIKGHRVVGVPDNRIRAIMVEYLHGVEAALSKSDSSSERFPLPALDAWYETYIVPIQGAFAPEALENDRMRPIDVENPLDDSGLRSANQRRGGKSATRGQ
jgi:hypothetical protein